MQGQNLVHIAENYKNKYINLFNEKLSKTLNILELKRKEVLKQALAICSLYFLFAILCLFGYFALRTVNTTFALFLIIFSAVLVVFGLLTVIEKNSNFIKFLKEESGNKILTILGNLHYSNTQFLESDIIESTIFPSFATLNTEDCIVGKYKETDLKICETSLFLDSDAAFWNRVYRGVVILFKSNKTIKNTTTVISKSEINWKFPALILILAFAFILCIILALFLLSIDAMEGILLVIGFGCVFAYIFYEILKKCHFFKRQPIACEKLLKLMLEDTQFNKKFKAYSSDQIEGRYLLTTAFMERLLNIQTTFGTKDIKCSFYDDKLMIAISTNKNLFELGNLFCKVDKSIYIERFLDEIISIFIMIDYFKLDENTKL